MNFKRLMSFDGRISIGVFWALTAINAAVCATLLFIVAFVIGLTAQGDTMSDQEFNDALAAPQVVFFDPVYCVATIDWDPALA